MSYYTLKVLLAGDGGVGKTSIVKRFVKEDFKVEYRATVGVDIYRKEIKLNTDKIVNLDNIDELGKFIKKHMK